MSKLKMMLSAKALVGAAAIVSMNVVGLTQVASAQDGDSEPRMEFNDKGELIRPESDVYRRWIFVGTNVTPKELNEEKPVAFPGFHNTYMHPDDYDFFVENGYFRDGTQFIQENVAADTEGASGNGFFSGDIWGNKASVKSAERFPDMPGNWGYFKWQGNYDDKPKDASGVFPYVTCNKCHVQHAEETDYVFVDLYPVLEEAGFKGKE